MWLTNCRINPPVEHSTGGFLRLGVRSEELAVKVSPSGIQCPYRHKSANQQLGIWRGYAFPFGEGAPVRTLGRKRAVKRKSFLMFRRNDRSLSRPRLRSATLPEGEGIGRH